MNTDPNNMDEEKTENPEEPRIGEFAKKKGEVVLREHQFDGIQEFDQKLPNWWLITLYVAIAWAAVHWFLYYHTSMFQTDAERMEQWEVQLAENKEAELKKVLENLNDEVLINQWSTDPDILAEGSAKYSTFCIACHAQDLSATVAGAPLPGLSLVDGEWKFGGKPMDIFKIIKDGSPPESEGHNGAKMVPWGLTLTPMEIAQLTAYVVSKNREEFPIDQ